MRDEGLQTTVRVCSPSRSIGVKPYGVIEEARHRLRARGFQVEIGRGDEARVDGFRSTPAAARAAELTAALEDDAVDVVLCATGGWNAIDVLEHLDWDRLAPFEKPVVGFSDITVLTTAFHARLGWQTFYGPNLATFGEDAQPEVTLDGFEAAVRGRGPITLTSTASMSLPASAPHLAPTLVDAPPMRALTTGTATGRSFGGNLGTLFLLQGTRYWPAFDDDVVLIIEEDDLAGKDTLVEALRRIRSLLLQPGLDRVAALVLGRFQPDAEVDPDLLAEGLTTIDALTDIPIVIDAPIGHTNPMATIPIGVPTRVDTTAPTPHVHLRTDPA